LKRICVFCGSSPGAKPEYLASARQLGQTLVQRKLGLVYGGARVGIMGEIAKTVHDLNGEVTGVIPRELFEKEVAFTSLSDLRVVETMHERKALMAELSDGFIALPGGLGTIEEFFEVLTWGQLNFHQKPCGLLNVAHYYDRLLDFMDVMLDQKFIDADHRQSLLVEDAPNALLDRFENYHPPQSDKAAWALNLTYPKK